MSITALSPYSSRWSGAPQPQDLCWSGRGRHAPVRDGRFRHRRGRHRDRARPRHHDPGPREGGRPARVHRRKTYLLKRKPAGKARLTIPRPPPPQGSGLSLSKKSACGGLFRQNTFPLRLRRGRGNVQGNLAAQGFRIHRTCRWIRNTARRAAVLRTSQKVF